MLYNKKLTDMKNIILSSVLFVLMLPLTGCEKESHLIFTSILIDGNEWIYVCSDTTEQDDMQQHNEFLYIQRVQGDTIKNGIGYKKVYNYFDFNGVDKPCNITVPEYYCYREENGKLYKEDMLICDMTLKKGDVIYPFHGKNFRAEIAESLKKCSNANIYFLEVDIYYPDGNVYRCEWYEGIGSNWGISEINNPDMPYPFYCDIHNGSKIYLLNFHMD